MTLGRGLTRLGYEGSVLDMTQEIVEIPLTGNRARYVRREEHMSDYDDPRICEICGRRFGYGAVGTDMVTGQLVHVNLDCTNRNLW